MLWSACAYHCVHDTSCLCIPCQPVHSCIETSLHQLDFFLEIFFMKTFLIKYNSQYTLPPQSSPQESAGSRSQLRLVYNMTQGLRLRCVVTGSAYKMIWTTTQRRNRNFFYFCVASLSKSFCIHFRSRRNAAATLASYYKPALMLKAKLE